MKRTTSFHRMISHCSPHPSKHEISPFLMGGTPWQKWGRGSSCACVTGDFSSMLNMTAGRGEKANMTDTGPHCLKGWTLPLAFGTHGILEEDFWNRVPQEAKSQLVLSPLPSGGHVDSRCEACQQCPGQACEQRPPTQTLKDGWTWTASGDQLSHLHLWYFGVGKEVPGATWNWADRGKQDDFSLGILEETGFAAEAFHYFQRPWW